jgi:2,4-diaminopentanoate dehydrogenase
MVPLIASRLTCDAGYSNHEHAFRFSESYCRRGTMREKYKIIVWGPGGLGGVALWEVARLDSLELVGVRAFSPDKVGKDAGDLIGIAPLGVTATDDVTALLALDADCVIYTPRDFGINNADAELIAILEAGHNVVTPLPYHNAVLYRKDGFGERIAQACAMGSSTFHATGIDPDLISDRVLMGMTGICTDITRIQLRELWDCYAVPAELLSVVGFGGPVEAAEASPIGPGISTNFLHAIGRTVEKTLGVNYARVEETHEYVPASTDVAMLYTKIDKGTLGRVVHRFRGWVDSIGSEPFFTMEYHWVVGPSELPEGVAENEYWVAEIEGTPSIRMSIDMRTTLQNDAARAYDFGSLQSSPGYHGTIAPCLQAIPHVVAGRPGVLPSFGPGLTWRQDLRTTTVGAH